MQKRTEKASGNRCKTQSKHSSKIVIVSIEKSAVRFSKSVGRISKKYEKTQVFIAESAHALGRVEAPSDQTKSKTRCRHRRKNERFRSKNACTNHRKIDEENMMKNLDMEHQKKVCLIMFIMM